MRRLAGTISFLQHPGTPEVLLSHPWVEFYKIFGLIEKRENERSLLPNSLNKNPRKS